MFQDQGPGSSGGLKDMILSRGAMPLIGAAAVVIVIVAIAAVALGSGGSDGRQVGARPTQVSDSGGLASTIPTPEATIDLERPTAVVGRDPTAPVPGAAGDRLVISRFGVSAPLTYKTVGADGVMPNPNGPDDVAFYDFAAWPGLGGFPGQGGNIVLAGHVDSGRVACRNGTVPPPCQAVFWEVPNMRVGDEIEVVVGGVTHRYRVTSNQSVHAINGDWNRIVASTQQETITLITCIGEFNSATREYSHRQVVVGVRI